MILGIDPRTQGALARAGRVDQLTEIEDAPILRDGFGAARRQFKDANA